MFRYEIDLVNKFIDLKRLETNFIRECSFRWGNIDIVEYQTKSISFLNSKQINSLKNKDNLHVFSLLYKKRPHTINYLSKETKLDEKIMKKKLNNLIELNIIKDNGNLFTVNEQIDFPDITVISYEMKLTDIRKALNQAVINKKYSDYSYVVMPFDKYDLCIKYRELFQKCSIGLILVDDEQIKEVIRPKRIKEINFNKLASKIRLVNDIENHVLIY
ncbi:hypothetical protein [Sinanaerobacter chloroacetimidivorans]|uniref:Uncharacterized protein n=1 Tax=Sinanaerobacter chloroacetimidivorans TaxID=2818044 RepID=A0A8J8B4D8_9FIRM|nr:hypothetical protein [Sinanaerobacter chloroacetimidivorans]MBR0599245.1 hypothetical protein [Sinanaerobacter chloroacetimidivorans]